MYGRIFVATAVDRINNSFVQRFVKFRCQTWGKTNKLMTNKIRSTYNCHIYLFGVVRTRPSNHI